MSCCAEFWTWCDASSCCGCYLRQLYSVGPSSRYWRYHCCSLCHLLFTEPKRFVIIVPSVLLPCDAHTAVNVATFMSPLLYQLIILAFPGFLCLPANWLSPTTHAVDLRSSSLKCQRMRGLDLSDFFFVLCPSLRFSVYRSHFSNTLLQSFLPYAFLTVW